MANSLTTNPIILTGTQSSYKAAVASSLGTLFVLQVTRVYWFDPTAVGDEFVLIDPSDGHEWLRGRCESAGISQIFVINKPWSDFACVELDSGSLRIYTA
jgi:hypothetical protein